MVDKIDLFAIAALEKSLSDSTVRVSAVKSRCARRRHMLPHRSLFPSRLPCARTPPRGDKRPDSAYLRS